MIPQAARFAPELNFGGDGLYFKIPAASAPTVGSSQATVNQ